MNSKLFIGYVKHNRYAPTSHQFKYPLYVYGVDLDELDALDQKNPFFGYNHTRLSTIWDKDYLDTSNAGIKMKLMQQLEHYHIDTPVSKVILITSPRYLNYVFNPVSFYYCYSKQGDLCCIAVEVNNTYGEKHLYMLQDDLSAPADTVRKYTVEKAFHVSPFNKIEGVYKFYLSDIQDDLHIRIELIHEGNKIFDAELYGKAIPLTFLNHLKLIATHPIVPHLSIPRIYWEAGKLFFHKKLAFNDKPVPLSPATLRTIAPTLIQRICMGVMKRFFEKMTIGSMDIILPDGKTLQYGDKTANMGGMLHIRSYDFFSKVLLGGDIGLGESYMENIWDSPDLVAVFRVFIENREIFSDANFALAIFARTWERLANQYKRNNTSGSTRNIQYHYDLGDDFYRIFLDKNMTYSCGIYEHESDTLETAQQNKSRTLIQKADIQQQDHVLEIGCGWGSFAMEAAERTGCRVTGITISNAQYNLACKRVEQAGLKDRVTILQKDYRDIEGQYDKIVSVEMLEAVGREYYPIFFKICDRLLKPDGCAVLQVITIPDHHYDQYRKDRDFIQKHIFPGGHLPSLTVLCQAMASHTRFTLAHLEDIGIHYARTLKDWRHRFISQQEKIAAMGFDKMFMRKWTYYLSCCEAGFERRALGDIQMVLKRAR